MSNWFSNTLGRLKEFNTNLLYGWRAGRMPFPTWVDQWQTQRSPTTIRLVDQYKETAYACANINARAVCSVPYHLYAMPDNTSDVESWPAHRTVSKAVDKYLRKQPALTVKTAGKQIVEIFDHPVLNLLETVNQELDGFVLFELTDLYCEITGTAYWYLEKDSTGTPTAIWPIPTQYMRLVRGEMGPLYYMYGLDNEPIPLDEVIKFTFPNLRDPYGDLGTSPLRACWESANLDDKDRAYAQAMLDNSSRPDIIISTKESVGDRERKAVERSYQRKFRKGSTGGVLVLDSAADVKTLSFNSKEMELLARKAVTKVSMANAFDVPLALLETKNINRATLEGAHYQLAKHSTLPRLTRIFQRLNHHLLPMFDPKLFLWFDNPVPDDELMAAQVATEKLKNGIIVINEVRADEDKEPVPWGDLPWMPATMVQVGGASDDSDEPTVTPESVLQGPQILAAIQIVSDVSAGTLPRDAGIGLLITTFNLTEDQAEEIMGTAGTGATLTPDDNGKPDPLPLPGIPAANPTGVPTKPGQSNEPPKTTAKPGNKPADKPPVPEKDPKKSLLIAIDWKLGILNDNLTTRALMLNGYSQKEALAVVVFTTGLERPDATTAHMHKHSVGHNRKLPKGEKIKAIMQDVFARQRKEVLHKLKSIAINDTVRKGVADLHVDLSDWDERMTDECGPVIQVIWEQGAEECVQRLGLMDQPELYNVANPKAQAAIKHQTMKFCKETNATTSLRINDAVKQLRQNLGDALASGDTLPTDLVKVVSDIFDGAEDWKAEQIAMTESSRALHAGQKMAAKESGIVSGFKWLLSDNACDECQQIVADNPDGVGLGESFDTDKDGGPYAITEYPPLHPWCQCTVTEILNDLSGSTDDDDSAEGDDE